MNYALKTMAFVFALGVLATHNTVQSANILGCSNCTPSSNEDLFKEISELSNSEICHIAKSNKGKWETNSAVKEHVREAAKRDINCGITKKNPFMEQITNFKNSESYKSIPKYWCENISSTSRGVMPIPTANNFSKNKCPGKRTSVISKDIAIEKFNSTLGRNYLCNLFQDENNTIQFNEKFNVYSKIASLISLKCKKIQKYVNLNDIPISKTDRDPKRTMSFFSDRNVCKGATKVLNGNIIWNMDTVYIAGKPDMILYLKEAKIRNLNCGVKNFPNQQIVIREDKESKRLAEQERQKRIELEKKLAALEKKPQSKVIVEDKESKRLAEEERQKRKELEKKLAILSKKNNVNVDKLVRDNTAPVISAQSKQEGFYATISGTITDDVKLAEVLIDNILITPNNDGTFNTKLYVPRNGVEVKILAFDMKGNKATKTLTVERGAIEEASGPVFASLDPSAKKVKSNPNALALIVGVADYEKTNADAIYADKDAQQFYDYARMKLGIPAKNIKELVNNKADRIEITLAIKDWIARSTKQGKTDIYLYFAGHGLATEDGKDMFLLPYDGLPRLLQESALKRDQLFANIKQANPRSVTVFLDTCYSGTTRGTDMLIASRPIAIRAIEQSIPDNFTVFSAAAGDQTSKPLEEAKHGMFSYFLMKGMEGDADANNDNKITARELHAYVEQNVVQQSSGSQTPELQGDKDRVLVQFN